MNRRTWIAAIVSLLFGSKATAFTDDPCSNWKFMEKRKLGDKVFNIYGMESHEFYSGNSKYSGIVLDPKTFIPYRVNGKITFLHRKFFYEGKEVALPSVILTPFSELELAPVFVLKDD
jgi:hypothetical protein